MTTPTLAELEDQLAELEDLSFDEINGLSGRDRVRMAQRYLPEYKSFGMNYWQSADNLWAGISNRMALLRREITAKRTSGQPKPKRGLEEAEEEQAPTPGPPATPRFFEAPPTPTQPPSSASSAFVPALPGPPETPPATPRPIVEQVDFDSPMEALRAQPSKEKKKKAPKAPKSPASPKSPKDWSREKSAGRTDEQRAKTASAAKDRRHKENLERQKKFVQIVVDNKDKLLAGEATLCPTGTNFRWPCTGMEKASDKSRKAAREKGVYVFKKK